MNKSLLPVNASDLEIAADTVSETLEAFPVPLRALWNPDTCPERLLPYLAWAFSVDRWDKDWPEQTKRDVIKASMFVHQHKGTVGAIKRALEPLGYVVKVKNWWQTQDPPGTFRLEIGVQETGITDEMYREFDLLISDVKPVSRHLLGITILMNSHMDYYCGVISGCGDVLTIYPNE